jgi:hypothetical protein
MPYGIAKRFGGDSRKNDARMEKQVKAIMASSHVSKVSAIKIAKAMQAARAQSRKRGR